MNNRVVHFEIPCDNPDKTLTFFKDVFGWTFQQFGSEEYWFAITGEDSVQGINGAIMRKRDPGQPLVNTLSVDNIDEYTQKVESAGGKIVLPKMAVPSMGWVAYFTDPDGNIHGMWQDDALAQ